MLYGECAGTFRKKHLEEFIKSYGRHSFPSKYRCSVRAVILPAGLTPMILGNFLFGYMRRLEKSAKAIKIIEKLIDNN